MAKAPPSLSWDELATKYCEKQEITREGLRARLKALVDRYSAEGFMLLEAADMSSSWCGQLTILPYGGSATYREVPTHPISPRGLASDMSTVIGVLSAEVFLAESQKGEA